MANQEILDKVLDTITTTPQRWNQIGWLDSRDMEDVPQSMISKIEEGADAACGTTACLAGHAMLASGKWKQVIVDVSRDENGKLLEYEVQLLNVKTNDDVYGQQEIEGVYASEPYVYYGAEALGIPYDLAYKLFMSMDWRPEQAEEFAAWVRAEIAEWEGRCVKLTLKPEIKMEWVAALRSGDYAQGDGALKKVDSSGAAFYCCLGVLCDLAVKAGVSEEVDVSGDEAVGFRPIGAETVGRQDFLPADVAIWAGLLLDDNAYDNATADSACNPTVPSNFGDRVTLSWMNDEGASFSRIADAIDENF